MMIEAPEADTSRLLAVVPESADLEADAQEIASYLRRANWQVELGFKGNSKKRVEAARRKGIKAILFVKPGTGAPKLHLSDISRSPEEATKLLLQVLGNLPDRFEQLSGDDL